MPKHWSTTIQRWDNPETIRLRKYLTGTHLLLQALEVDTAATPNDVVWSRGPARLVRYRSGSPRRHPVPVMLAYPPILRSYILDLVPGTSLVEYLLAEGFDVYLLDFGVPGSADRQITLDDYVLDYFPTAVEKVGSTSEEGEVTVAGYCMAGSLAAMYAAATPAAPVRNLILVAAPIDFAPSPPGLLGAWTAWTRQPLFPPRGVAWAARAPGVDRLVRLVEKAATGGLTPYKLDMGRLPAPASYRTWLALCRWVDDGIPFPGAALQQWYRDLFQHNSLIKGQQRLGGERVELAEITSPVLAVAGTLDAITPLAMAHPWPEVLSRAPVDFLTLSAGHIGLMVGPAGPREFWPYLGDWLASRSGSHPVTGKT